MTLLRISKIKRVCVMHLAPRMFRSVGGAPGKFHRLNYVTVWNGHDRDGADDGRKIRKVALPPSQPFCHVGKPKVPYEILPQHISTTGISENKLNSDSETTYPADKKGNSVITLDGVRLKEEPSALEDEPKVHLRARNIKMIKLQANLIKFTEQAFDYDDMTTKQFKIAFSAEEIKDKAAAATQMNENYLKFCPETEETQCNISFDDIMTCKRTPNTLLVRSSVKEKKKTEKKKEKDKMTESKDMPLLAATIVSEENKKLLHYFNEGVLVNLLVPTELEMAGSVSKGSVKKQLKEPASNVQAEEEAARSYVQARASSAEQVTAPCNIIFEDPLPDINLRDETIPLTELLQRARERNRIMYCREVGQQLAVQMKTFMAKRRPPGPCPPPSLPQKPPCPPCPVGPPACPSPWPPLCPSPFAVPCPPPCLPPWPPLCPPPCPPPSPPPCPSSCPPSCLPPLPPSCLPPWPPLCPPACPPPCPKPCPPCPPPEFPKPCGPNLFPPPCPPPMRPPVNPPPPFRFPEPKAKCPPPKCPPPTCPPPPPPKCPPPPPKCPPPPRKCPPSPCPPPKCPPPPCPPPKCPPPPPKCPPPPPKCPPPPPKCPPPPPKCPPPPPKCPPPPPKCPPPPPKCPPPKPKCPPPCPPPKKRPKRECPPGTPPKCKPPQPKCPPPPRSCPPPPKPKPKCPVPAQPPPKCPPPKCPDPPKCRVEDAISLAARLDRVEKFPKHVMPVVRLHNPDFRSLQNRNDVTSRGYLLYIFRLLLKTFTRS